MTFKTNTMKTKFFSLFLFGAFLLTSTTLSAQVIKLRSTGLAYKVQTDDEWSDWSDFEDTDVLITLDVDNSRFTVYSAEKQVYDISENEGMTTDSDGDDFYAFYCVDQDGKTCRIRFAILHSQDESMQLYVDFNDMKWVYNVRNIED